MKLSFAAVMLLPGLALAHPGSHEPGVTHDPDTGAHVGGGESSESGDGSWTDKLVFRGGAALDLNKTINLGGTNDGETPIRGSLEPGVGYHLLDNLTLDLDAESHFLLSPRFEISDLGLTPGARFYPFTNVYVRGGAPLLFLPEFGLGVLAGAGYMQPLGGLASLVVGVDYTYYLTDYYRQVAPQGRVDLNAGIQTRF